MKKKTIKTPFDQILQSAAKSPLTWETDQYGSSQLLSMMYACVEMFAGTQQDPFSVLHANLCFCSQISSEVRTFLYLYIYARGGGGEMQWSCSRPKIQPAFAASCCEHSVVDTA